MESDRWRGVAKELKSGTIVEATIIAAPSSTKNAAKARDTEMKQAMKGKAWYFGMRLPVGTDCKTGRVAPAVRELKPRYIPRGMWITRREVHRRHDDRFAQSLVQSFLSPRTASS